MAGAREARTALCCHILNTAEAEPDRNTNGSALPYLTVLCHTVCMPCAQSKAITYLHMPQLHSQK